MTGSARGLSRRFQPSFETCTTLVRTDEMNEEEKMEATSRNGAAVAAGGRWVREWGQGVSSGRAWPPIIPPPKLSKWMQTSLRSPLAQSAHASFPRLTST